MRIMTDHRYLKISAYIMTGEHFVSGDDIIIQTVLGSCVSVCLFSDRNACAGMNHFMLPGTPVDERRLAGFSTDSGLYGLNSMELLINDLMKNGVRRDAMKAKVFGGGSVMKDYKPGMSVGELNIRFVTKFLEVEKIPIVACSLGGNYGRKVLFFTSSKEVLLMRLNRYETELVETEQNEFRKKQSPFKIPPDITFFQ